MGISLTGRLEFSLPVKPWNCKRKLDSNKDREQFDGLIAKVNPLAK